MSSMYMIENEEGLFFTGVKNAKWSENKNHAKLYLLEKSVLQAFESLTFQGAKCEIVMDDGSILSPRIKRKKPKSSPNSRPTGIQFFQPATIRSVASYVGLKLKAKGFVVFRYNAYSTNSVYLKLDHGMGKSIRISDHKGMDRLNYRYNVLSTVTEPVTEITQKEYARHYYGFDQEQIDLMIETALKSKMDQIDTYSKDSYERLMAKNYQENSMKPGFWLQSWQI